MREYGDSPLTLSGDCLHSQRPGICWVRDLAADRALPGPPLPDEIEDVCGSRFLLSSGTAWTVLDAADGGQTPAPSKVNIFAPGGFAKLKGEKIVLYAPPSAPPSAPSPAERYYLPEDEIDDLYYLHDRFLVVKASNTYEIIERRPRTAGRSPLRTAARSVKVSAASPFACHGDYCIVAEKNTVFLIEPSGEARYRLPFPALVTGLCVQGATLYVSVWNAGQPDAAKGRYAVYLVKLAPCL